MKKLTYEFVRSEFEKEGYKLLTNIYKNAHQKLNYICPNGHSHSIIWNAWQRGFRCPYCSNKNKKTIEFIRYKFKNENYKLLTAEYKDAHKKLECVCPKGHRCFISWAVWNRGIRCPYCANVAKPTIEFIKDEFKKENYTLLTKKYKNNKQKLEFICPKGHRYFIRWNNWHSGARCFICANINHGIEISGQNHPNWKGGISCEPYCDVWADKEYKESIKERDGYRCLNPDCWKISERLTIHHIDYNKKNCEPSNLITLCNSCNSRANTDRKWHKAWYEAILNKRYGYEI